MSGAQPSLGECILIWRACRDGALELASLPSGAGLLLKEASGPVLSSLVDAEFPEDLSTRYEQGIKHWQAADTLASTVQQVACVLAEG